MNHYALDLYRQMFLSLKRGRSGNRKSNAKPIFLLSIIEIVPYLKGNLIPLSAPVLREYYKTNCEAYDTGKSSPLILPYYHMHTEPFYSLCWNDENNITSISHSPSVKELLQYIRGSKLDDELWELLQDESNRSYLRECLIKYYFTSENK